MKDQIESRLEALKREFEAGETQLRDLDTQRVRIHEALLRISGAVQALEELLVDGRQANGAVPEGIKPDAAMHAS